MTDLCDLKQGYTQYGGNLHADDIYLSLPFYSDSHLSIYINPSPIHIYIYTPHLSISSPPLSLSSSHLSIYIYSSPVHIYLLLTCPYMLTPHRSISLFALSHLSLHLSMPTFSVQISHLSTYLTIFLIAFRLM